MVVGGCVSAQILERGERRGVSPCWTAGVHPAFVYPPPPSPLHLSPITTDWHHYCPLSRLPMAPNTPLVWWGSLQETNICRTKSCASFYDVTSPGWPRPSPAQHTADSFVEKITENFKQIGNYRELSRKSFSNDENFQENMSHIKTAKSSHY